MIDIKALSKENFKDFFNLLNVRGSSNEELYEWKYFNQPLQYFPTGFIAYFDNIPVGCIGLLNRTYIDGCGNEYPATWFADWYVDNSIRGKGIGLALMKKVFGLSSFAFGIPGPPMAQIIAQKAGYLLQNDFYELQMPIKEFFFGYHRYKESFLKKIIRGALYQFSYFNFTVNKPYKLQEYQGSFGFEITKCINTLKIDDNYINWIKSIPVSCTKKRNWYIVESADFNCLFFTELDYCNLFRAKIVSVNINSKIDEMSIFYCLKAVMKKLSVIYLTAYVHKKPNQIYKKVILKKTPQVSSMELSPSFIVSLADKESSFVDLLF